MTAVQAAAFWFLLGGLAYWASLRVANYLALRAAKNDSELGRKARSQFLAGLDHDRLLEFQKKVEQELERRRS